MVTVALAVRRPRAARAPGFVLNGDGEIVTNAHVVTTGEGARSSAPQQVYVEFADGNRVQARRCSGTTRTPTSRCCASTRRA